MYDVSKKHSIANKTQHVFQNPTAHMKLKSKSQQFQNWVETVLEIIVN